MFSKSLTMSAMKKCVEMILKENAKYMFLVFEDQRDKRRNCEILPAKFVQDVYEEYYKWRFDEDLTDGVYKIVRFGHTSDLKELENYI